MRVAITGGLGFVGLALAEHFARGGHDVTIVDVVDAARGELPEGVRAVSGDVRDRARLVELMRGAELVVHAASRLPGVAPREIVSTSIDGTANALEAARTAGARSFVFVSSTAVYPTAASPRRDEHGPRIGEGSYATAKIAAEDLCTAAAGSGMSVSVLRPVPIVGPRRQGVFRILFEWVREGRAIPMVGDGSNHCQLLDVDDLCTAVEVVATRPGDDAAIFNVGAAEYGTVREDLTALCDAAATGARVLPTPGSATRLALRVLHATRLTPLYPWLIETAGADATVSIARLSALGWRPRKSNVEALVDAYRWFLAHASDQAAHVLPGSHRSPWDPGALGLLRRLF